MGKCKTYFYGVGEYTRSMGCILSRLLFFATIINWGACTDDSHLQSVDDKAPLQLSVGTSSLASRHIITDDYLPDASRIGVSLFDNNGDAYDGQLGYVNAKYTASGAGVDQTWTTEQNITVTAEPATVIAYYPYNGDENIDLTKVSVETASQTDYMFSKPVANINNTNPDAKIILYHALTAIRVRLVLGDFTGDAAVTNVAVSSPALASNAELDVYNGLGALSNITGQGEVMTRDVDFTMSTQGTDTDVMLVPDASVTEGSTTVFATIGSKKYTAAISFDEAYLQGYIYTYTLTLNNSGFQLTKVNVTPWQTGTEESDKLQYSFQEDDYIVEIQVPEDNYTYYHNMMGYKGIINWGDASVETIENFDDSYTKSSFPSHVYEKAGTYTVRFSGTIDALYTIGSLTPIITKVIYAGDELDISDIQYAFYKQTLLTEVPEGLFDSCNNNVTNAASTFYNCTSLQTIPADLFDDLQYVTDFSYTFQSSGLTSIPEGLFDNCVNAMYWGDDCYEDGTFAYCENLTTIPAGLFNKCTKTTLFPTVFAYCYSLQTIPDDMFNGWQSVKTFDSTFRGCDWLVSVGERAFANCSALTVFEEVFKGSGLQEIKGNIFEGSNNIGTFYYTFRDCKNLTIIPAGLFDNCTEVTSFYGTFEWCTRLTSIPEGLFYKCTEVTDFSNTFYGCGRLTSVPERLFDNCTKVTDFSDTFNNCTSLTSIPTGLFDKCTEVTSFYSTFMECESLTSIPEGLFYNNKKVTLFYKTFFNCKKLLEIPTNTFGTEMDNVRFTDVFFGTGITTIKSNAFNCPNLKSMVDVFKNISSLTTVEENAFNCPNVTSFEGTFEGCTSLQTIPEGLFDKCTEVTDFTYTFYGCTSLQSIPERLFDNCTEVTSFDGTFRGCSSLQTIPEGLFDKCTEVTGFNGTFYGCVSFSEIPAGLFDNCTEVMGFGYTFMGCTSLTSIPNGLFDNCTEVTSFYAIFQECTSLTAIPERLFDYNTKVTSFSETFSGCTKLTGESPYTIIQVTDDEGNITDINVHLYERSNYPEYFTAPTSYSYCFSNCSGLTDYSSIPSKWK